MLRTTDVDYVDNGEWIACLECSSLIQRKEWKALMARAVDLNPAMVMIAKLGEPQLRKCMNFVARNWAKVFDLPPETFL
jgi:hypothetical protein